MANICQVCDKRPSPANSVSNANNRVIRWVYPNVHVIRYSYKGQKNVHRGAVCTKCVKAGIVEKVL